MIECRHGNIPSHCDSCGKDARIEKLEAWRREASRIFDKYEHGIPDLEFETLDNLSDALASFRSDNGL